MESERPPKGSRQICSSPESAPRPKVDVVLSASICGPRHSMPGQCYDFQAHHVPHDYPGNRIAKSESHLVV